MDEGTNGLPPKLEAKLVEAKNWSDRREQLEETIRVFGGIAERNQADRDTIDLEAASILEEIVEIIDQTWGWGRTW